MKSKFIYREQRWSIKNSTRIGVIIGFIVCVSGYYVRHEYDQAREKVPQVCMGQRCFTIELANTPAARMQGLMYREAMSDNHGMLFIFSQSDLHNFWMKNTLIPLDMIWIDDQNKIVRILTAQPCKADPCPTYMPETYARYVLEINGGLADKYTIRE